MALTQRFRDVVLDSAVRIGDLTVHKVYPVLRAESVDTKYGLSILLTIRESDDHCVSVSTAPIQPVLFRRSFGSERTYR
jgi:hypothetical protein